MKGTFIFSINRYPAFHIIIPCQDFNDNFHSTHCNFQEPGVALTDEEVGLNEQVFKETIANEFPDEDMLDKTFRDKVIMMMIVMLDKMKMGNDFEAGDALDNTRDKLQ